MDDYVSKPIQPNQLITILERHVNRQISAKTESYAPISAKSTEIFNKEQLLGRVQGDQEFMQKIIGKYITNLPITLEALNKALAENNMETILDLAVTIKGNAAYMSANSMRYLAMKIETAARDQNLPKIYSLLNLLQREFEKFKKMAA